MLRRKLTIERATLALLIVILACLAGAGYVKASPISRSS